MMQTAKQFLVSCHRGCTERAPENTVAAARDALRLGVDLIECDVRTTADGHLVIMHDSTVDRTTDGFGPISGMTLAQVRRLRIRDTRFACLGTHRVPTLAELVTAVGRRAGFYIDTKDVHPAALKRIIRDPKVIAKSFAYISTDEGLPPAKGQTYRLRVGAFFEIKDKQISRITNYYNLQDWIEQVVGK